jgi:UDP-N-acetylmuramoyl-tripeptide--D-alanyl-D-alanine ligase
MMINQLYKIYQQYPEITTDSRNVPKNSIFFALKGGNFNGNKYAKDALAKGASYAVIDEIAYQEGEQYIVVDDVLLTLQALALFHRRQLRIPFLAITGSNGKTTTKELISAVLSTGYITHFTNGNFNNHIGVPLTLLSIPRNTEIAVIEMGANHQAEINLLCHIAEPTHGVITNIGKAHLEGFGGIEGVKKGKSELYQFLATNNGIVFLNTDVEHLPELANERAVKQLISYNKELGKNYQTKIVEIEPFVKVELSDTREATIIQSNLIGSYNATNILAAIAIGKFFYLSNKQIKIGIEQYIPQNNRSQIIQKENNTFILDAYNANPTSTQHAVQHFATIKADKKIAILGDMLELGSHSHQEHQAMVILVNNLAFDKVIFVGKEYSKVINCCDNIYFSNVQELKEWFDQQSFEQTHFLVKGSRGIRLEKLLQ